MGTQLLSGQGSVTRGWVPELVILSYLVIYLVKKNLTTSRNHKLN